MRLQTLLQLLPLTGLSTSASTCRCQPSDACWPSEAQWLELNKTTQGAVQQLQPVGAVCHGSTYDAVRCNNAMKNELSSVWRSAHPAAVEWPNWETWPEKNESCYIDTDRSIPCGQGRVSLYSVLARSVDDIQAGVRFAAEHNLRLAIRNTGHDFAGRSVAPESLQINTHMLTSKVAHKNFKPLGCTGHGEGQAVTLGAGVQLYDMYTWLAEQGLIVVGGDSHGVGVTGGYIQGGGHSPISAVGGMASDNALEFKVVTAKGEHITANACHNPDLFWALRGGGGGSWGVVTSLTTRAYTDFPVVTFTLTGQTAFGDKYWEAMEHFHGFLADFNDAGGNMYYYLMPDINDPKLGHQSGFLAYGSFGNNSDKAAVDKLMLPLVQDLGNITGTPFQYSSNMTRKASATFAAQNAQPDLVGQPAILGSRLITRDFMKSQMGPKRVTDALRSFQTYPGNTYLGQNAIQGLVVAGPAVRANADKVDSALHPVWRKALLHLIIVRGWSFDTPVEDQLKIQQNLTDVEVPILKKLDPAPVGGAYLNEADGYETDFQDSFWGPNYPRLYELKQKWDPQNLFIVRTGVGSENWDAEGLCTTSR